MIAAIVPQFLSCDLQTSLAYYRETFGFETQFEYGDPAFFAGAIRDGHSIFFRAVADAPAPIGTKYEEEWLDAYIRTENIDALFEEFGRRGAEFARPIGDMPWGFREFVVKDCDGRLLCFGQFIEESGAQ